MNNNKKKLKKILLLVVGLVICSYFVFVRLLKERLPYEVDFSWNPYMLIFYMGLFLFFCYIIKQKVWPKESKNKLMGWVKEQALKASHFYDDSLDQGFNLIFSFRLNNRNYFGELLDKVCKLIKKLSYTKFYQNIYNKLCFYYLVTIIPRLIITILFFVDMVCYNKFFLFYKYIWVLLIPFFWRIFFFILNAYFQHGTRICFVFLDVTLTPIYDEDGKQAWERLTWFRRKNPVLRGEILNPTEEEYLDIEKEAPFFFSLYCSDFFKYFKSDGPIAQAPLYLRMQLLIYILYAVTFGYMVVKVSLSYNL